MFIADETHERLMKAEAGLEAAKLALDEGKWAASVLAMLLAAAEVDEVASAVTIAQDKRKRIYDMLDVLKAGQAAVVGARAALDFARSKIPNTIDAGTLEVCPSPDRVVPLVRGQTYNYRKDSQGPAPQPRDVSRVVYVELKHDDPRVALVHSEPFLAWVHDLEPLP